MKKRLTLALLGIALVWPPLHMVATAYFGFSSWRFFGWGMYAEPHPESFANVRILYAEGTAPRECPTQAPAHERLQVFVAAGDDFRPISPCEDRARANELVRRVLHLGDRAAMAELAGTQATVLITRQRLSVTDGKLYTLTTKYDCRAHCELADNLDSRLQNIKTHLKRGKKGSSDFQY